MNRSTPGVSPLRQRMLEDMHLRKLEPKTQTCYVRAVRKLAEFLARSPDTATAEDLRLFQLHLVDQGTSPITLNATLTGLKFFFGVTPGRGELMAKTSSVRVPQTLPVVLSREEVARLIGAVTNLKQQTALPTQVKCRNLPRSALSHEDLSPSCSRPSCCTGIARKSLQPSRCRRRRARLRAPVGCLGARRPVGFAVMHRT